MKLKLTDQQPILSQANPSSNSNAVTQFLTEPTGMLLMGMIGFITFLKILDSKGKKKNILAKARWGGEKEKRKAMQMAMKQIEKRKRNPIALYLDRPKATSKTPLMLPDMNRGSVIIGSPGTGKTISSFLPMIYSGIDQGFPMVIYDFKYPDLTEQVVGLAAKKGYNIHIFAPGYKESKICNPLDFIDKENPSLMAAQFAEVLNRNFKGEDSKGEDQFFKKASDMLVKGILMLAKETEFPDLLTCDTLLGLSSLTDRLIFHQNKIRELTYRAFASLLASAGSEKTVAGIIASATNNFSSMMIPEILASLTGKTDLPIEVTGKSMIILGLDQEKRDVLTPILALILDLMIARNVRFKRKDPLLLFLDECATMYLPRLPNWLNEFRSKGLCTTLGIQNIVQMEHKYGKELTRAILGGCNTKIWYNPQDFESAKLLSDSLGNEEVKYKQRSRTTGGKGSTSISEQIQSRPLFSADECLRLQTGERIITSPGYQSHKEAYIPIRDQVVINDDCVVSPLFTKTLNESSGLWVSCQEKLSHQSSQQPIGDDYMRQRRLTLEEVYALPKDHQQGQGKGKGKNTIVDRVKQARTSSTDQIGM